MLLAVLLGRLTAMPLGGLLLVWTLAWPAYATPHAIRVGTFATYVSGVNPAYGSYNGRLRSGRIGRWRDRGRLRRPD